ncbi:hypothetical protein TNCV_1684661 [Trichonephila clavipes]|nr:hypothetical protein TNCV_1684661 [Trichonephila clavipes]
MPQNCEKENVRRLGGTKFQNVCSRSVMNRGIHYRSRQHIKACIPSTMSKGIACSTRQHVQSVQVMDKLVPCRRQKKKKLSPGETILVIKPKPVWIEREREKRTRPHLSCRRLQAPTSPFS